jgi:alpha-mannosidase
MFGNGNNGMIRPPDPDRSFTLATAELVCINVPVHGLFWDLECLHGLGISSKDAATVANVVTAISRILNAVDLRDAESLRQCRAVAQTILDAPDAVKIDHDVTAVGHCHIDTAWLWSYKETRRKVARSWCTQLSLMDAYPDWRFVASQAVQWEWLEDGCPDLFERVKARVDDGRFIPIGGTYVEFDANIPSLESFIRQFLYGSQYFRDKLGLATDVFWLPDTFGYSAQLPQVMRGFNIKYFLSQKLSWNLFNKFPHSTFTWEGIDGSSVLAHFPPSDTYNASCSAQDFLKCSENHKSLISCNQSMLLFGHGDGGGGPHPSHLAHLERYKTSKGLPRIHTDRTPSDFFKGVEQDFKLRDKALSTPTWQGELYLELHQGTLTSQATIKKQNRQCEHLMRVVEALFVKVVLSGRLEQSLILETLQAVDKLWKDILLNQFHDVMYVRD